MTRPPYAPLHGWSRAPFEHETIMAIIAVLLAIVAVALLFKVMADAAKFNELRAERDDAKKDARKNADRIKDMEGKLTSKSQEVGTAKDQKRQVQEAEAAKRAAEQTKKEAEQEKAQVETRNRELNETLGRVRIEKEQQRQELVAARDRLRELGETASQIERLKAEKDEAVQAANAAARRAAEAPAAAPVVVTAELDAEREERQSSKLRRDLDALRKSSDKLEEVVQTWKQKALESESNYRRLHKRFNDSTLLWNTTQSQLDLALDEIHLLRTGAPPEHQKSDKSKKRAALKPGEKPFEILPGEVVVLPDARPSESYADDEAAPEAPKAERVEAPKAEKVEAPKVEVEAPKVEKVEAPKAAPEAPKAELSKADALKAKLAESKAKADAARAAKAEPVKAEAPAKAEPVKAEAPAKEEATQKPVLRKKEPEPEPAKAGDKKAPPRPKAKK